jgi:tryptophan halogenase
VNAPVRRVVVVGRDAAAWLVALGLQRAFGRTGVAVHVVELPSLLRPVDVYAAVPSLGGLHRLLGLPEAVILTACRGVPTLGQRFANWSRSKPPFVHAYDIQRPAINEVSLLQYWVKAREQGLNVALEDFSLAAAAAKQGRFSADKGDPDSLAALSPGYHLDAVSYVRLVRQAALQSKVTASEGMLGSVERDGDRIGAILLDDGERIEGDLFIDASGAEAALIGGMSEGEFEPWSRWLGCDRILAASAPPLRPLPAFSQISAFAEGWIGLHPLQDRTALVACYDSADLSDEAMLEKLAVLAGVKLTGEAVTTPFRAGARPRPWIGNCIAVGDAAVSLEPLDAIQLHLVHIGLSNLIALFPVDAEAMPEAEAYNQAIGTHAANVRDFQIAHYKLNQRFDEPFWDRARESAGPASLDAKIALFASRGIVALYEDESFQDQNWSAIFIGHGLIPKSYDPSVDRIPQQEQIEKFRRLLQVIAAEVQKMPTIETYLANIQRQPAG